MTRSAVVLAALCAAAGCYEPNPGGPARSEALSLAVSADSAAADGATLVQLVGTVSNEVGGTGRTLTFTASAGTLLGAQGGSLTVTADENGVAVAELRAPTTPGLARIRLTVAGVTRSDSVRFVPARAERVDVEADLFALKAGLANQARITATLRRTTGSVAAGTRVRFQAVQADGVTSIGQFGAIPPSDNEGRVTVRYTAGETAYRGPVRIRAIVDYPGALEEVGETVIHVVNP